MLNKDFILPSSRRNEVINFVEKGLKDLSVSRTSFSWGIPVPKNKKHVIYVWLDALTNYISALNFPNTNDINYKKFWPADVHIIGKDILRFHAIYWPAFLLAAKLPLPKRVFGHGWILSDDKKMSKSIGNILDPVEIIKNYLIYFAHITFSNYERKKWKPMEEEQSWTSVVILQPFFNPSLCVYFILCIYLLV